MARGSTSLQWGAAAALALPLMLGGCASMGLPTGTPGFDLTQAPSTTPGDATAQPGQREIVVLPLARRAPPGDVRGPSDTRGVGRTLPAPASSAAALAASVPPPKRGQLEAVPPTAQEQEFDVVSVFWGTDRKIAAGPMPLARAPASHGAQIVTGSIDRVVLPGTERGDRLVLGRSYVTVPRIARERGTIQRPWQVAVLNVNFYTQSEDPRRHFTIGSFEPMDSAQFARHANTHMTKAVRNPGHALVFVHGFNSTFEDALYRTAQLAYDLEFDGVPYLYSWPSKGEETGYLYDRDSADRARRFFIEFLETVARETKAQKIHLIAHSLGNRPLLEALKAGGDPSKLAKRLRLDQVVLAAPDIDRDVFVDIAAALNGVSKGTTLYASNNDKALKLSRTLARGAPRAGDVPPAGPVVVAGVDTIDITAAGTDALLSLNHNTYAEGGHVLTDLRVLLRDGVRPPDRRFPVYLTQTTAAGTYWRYVRN
jgi:esterase/lipase superfamily enzyme